MAWPSSLARTKDWGTETMTDADLEGQFDLIISYINAMMDSSTGHKHDGTTAEGPKILTANIDDAAGAAGDIYVNTSGTTVGRVAIGTAAQFCKVNSGATAPEWAGLLTTDFPDGTVVASTYTQTVAMTTHATAVPVDDTAPTNTEGNEITNLDTAHTAASSTNKLNFDINLNVSGGTGQNTTAVVTLLDGTTVIAAAYQTVINNGTGDQVNMRYQYTPGDTAAHTYHVRIGNAAGGTFTVNGQSGARVLGGKLVSSVTITEVKAS